MAGLRPAGVAEERLAETYVANLKQAAAKATVELPAAWADGHPRTVHLLEEEVAAWERNGPVKVVLKTV